LLDDSLQLLHSQHPTLLVVDHSVAIRANDRHVLLRINPDRPLQADLVMRFNEAFAVFPVRLLKVERTSLTFRPVNSYGRFSISSLPVDVLGE
jgi:hypothetical protein